MDWRKDILKQLAVVAAGQVVGVAVMYGVFALFDAFDSRVLWGGMIGAVLALGNFVAMVLSVVRASDKAAEQEVKAGQLMLQGSYLLRMLVLFLILFALAKTQKFHVVALVVPLIFIRPALTVGEVFRKQGEKSNEC